MQTKSSFGTSATICLCAISALLLLAACGCYQRTIAPEVTYDPAQVEMLDQEIKKLDWEP